MARHLTFAALVLVAVVAAPVTAQDGKKYTLETKEGGWEVEELLTILGSLPDCTIQFDPNAPQIARKKIEIEGKVELGREEFFDWVRALLFQQRLVLVPLGPAGAHTWSAMDLNAPQLTAHPVHVPEAELPQWENRDGVYILTSVRLDHIRETARARNALAQMCTRQVGRVNDNPGSGTMVIADFAPVAVAMWKVLKQIDTDAAKADPAVVAASDPQIQRYEKYLATCPTETAAKYFIGRIQALMPKGEDE